MFLLSNVKGSRRRQHPTSAFIAANVIAAFVRAGVAYPISARLLGDPGAGAMRVCDFSTERYIQGYFVPETGDFTLVPLPGGRTRLLGTSVYHNRMWPSQYWQLCSDASVTRVHRRVFENVKQLAERDASGRAPGPRR